MFINYELSLRNEFSHRMCPLLHRNINKMGVIMSKKLQSATIWVISSNRLEILTRMDDFLEKEFHTFYFIISHIYVIKSCLSLLDRLNFESDFSILLQSKEEEKRTKCDSSSWVETWVWYSSFFKQNLKTKKQIFASKLLFLIKIDCPKIISFFLGIFYETPKYY